VTPVPTVASSAVVVSRIPTAEKVVALTYDAGADRGQATSLLAYLRDAGIQVTFGMTGRWAESNPELVRAIVQDGHELMNHTYDHRSLTGVSARPAVLAPSERLVEVDQTDAIIRSLTGVSTKPLFRPPYGDEDGGVLQTVARAGYAYSILWTVDSGGWLGHPVAQIVGQCLDHAEPGAIFALHVGGLSQDIEATPALVAGLRARGYRFATVGALLRVSHPTA
jgi:peptidoglycan/xylan/chitin deacetylase (PgdA/CDA1 family)